MGARQSQAYETGQMQVERWYYSEYVRVRRTRQWRLAGTPVPLPSIVWPVPKQCLIVEEHLCHLVVPV